MTGPLPGAVRVRKARKASRVACGHYVRVGHVIVSRAGRWTCIECDLALRTVYENQPDRRPEPVYENQPEQQLSGQPEQRQETR
jgi:hypothetical protein